MTKEIRIKNALEAESISSALKKNYPLVTEKVYYSDTECKIVIQGTCRGDIEDATYVCRCALPVGFWNR